MQNENVAMCKSATWNSAIHIKSATRKKVQHKKIVTQKSGAWKWRSMKKVQYEKSVTWKNINCHSEIWKKCTRIVHFSAQTVTVIHWYPKQYFTSSTILCEELMKKEQQRLNLNLENSHWFGHSNSNT